MKKITKGHTLALLLLVFVALACTINTGSNSNTAAPPSQMQQTAPPPAAPPAAPPIAKKDTTPDTAPVQGATKTTVDPCSRREQIKFKPGTDEITLDREICPDMTKEYYFKAQAGQYISYEFFENSGYVELLDNLKNPMVNSGSNIPVPSNGTYIFYIKNNSPNITIPYKMVLRIL